jgi:hypothetical protein
MKEEELQMKSSNPTMVKIGGLYLSPDEKIVAVVPAAAGMSQVFLVGQASPIYANITADEFIERLQNYLEDYVGVILDVDDTDDL